MEQDHWELLYQYVSLDVGGSVLVIRNEQHVKLRDIRSLLCDKIGVAEELAPLRVLRSFYLKHGAQAALPLQYPCAALLKDELPRLLVEAYCKVLRGRTLPPLGSQCMATFGAQIGRQAGQYFKLFSCLTSNHRHHLGMSDLL